MLKIMIAPVKESLAYFRSIDKILKNSIYYKPNYTKYLDEKGRDVSFLL